MVQDVDQQKIPVRFVITSAGLVGSDAPQQCGAFDITFMSCLPNMIVMAPHDEVELVNMVATAAQINDRPVCFRYPRSVVLENNCIISNGIPIEVIAWHLIFFICYEAYPNYNLRGVNYNFQTLTKTQSRVYFHIPHGFLVIIEI